MKRVIVCAAIRNHDGFIICGARHFDNGMRDQLLDSLRDWSMAEQGFIDQHGEFLNREQAHVIAVAAGQIVRRVGGDNNKLFSENLY